MMNVLGGGSANGGVPVGEGEPGASGGLFGGNQKVQFSEGKSDNVNPQAPDCYFYFYSTCSKGEQCKFRHCSAALGTEEVCDIWLQKQNCRRQICAFRHSVPERQRGAIPCFWETQAVGCLKPHCPFLHSKPRPQIPGALDRIDQFKKKEFESLKVKSLDEIREEKQLAQTTPTSLERPRQSYNRIYTPSHPPISTPSQTSFKLTSVLKTTGLAGGEKPNKTAKTTTSNEACSNATTSQLASATAHVVKPFATEPVGGAKKSAPPPLHLGVGGATMSVSDSSENLFISEKSPSSVFSPNYEPGPVQSVRGESGEIGEGGKVNISAITWEDGEGVRGAVEVKKESRIVRFQQTQNNDPTPVAKKVKLTLLSTPPPVAAPVRLVKPLPKATSSPVKLTTEKEKGVVVGNKVGVVIGGHGQSVGGVGDFHVKSLDEIKAEKRKRLAAAEVETTGRNEEAQSTPVQVKPQSVVGERKIIRIKKKPSAPVDSEGVKVGGGDSRESGELGGDGEEGGKSDDKKGVLEDSSSIATASKRRKLYRTPLPVVQATPTSDTPAMTSSEIEPKLTTDDQQEPNPTKQDHTGPMANDEKSGKSTETEIASKTETESVSVCPVGEGVSGAASDEVEGEGVTRERGDQERKLSISEMKAQIQHELKDRRVSDSFSLEQLDSELAQWEEELGEVGEHGEGVTDEEGLLDSKTDDDLMLEFAEFL